MGKLRVKPNYRRRLLRLPDLDHCKLAVLNSLGSPAGISIDQNILEVSKETIRKDSRTPRRRPPLMPSGVTLNGVKHL
jgi:hypothetical protein